MLFFEGTNASTQDRIDLGEDDNKIYDFILQWFIFAQTIISITMCLHWCTNPPLSSVNGKSFSLIMAVSRSLNISGVDMIVSMSATMLKTKVLT